MRLKTYTVTEITKHISRIFKSDILLNTISIKGEVSNFIVHGSGHLYFTLKDEGAKINCVMFKSNADTLNFQIEDGMELRASGYIDLFIRDGRYQLIVNNLIPEGIAKQFEDYMILFNKLNKAGYFNDEHKKPIPAVKRLGVITAKSGAALQDILTVLRRRNPFVEVLVYSSLVQGEGAVKGVVEGINYFNESESVDAILLSRGGGSKEDLSVFNNEIIVKAVFNSKIPIMTALGHEIDRTLCDYVSDKRAATPTEAAEFLSGNLYQKIDYLASVDKRIKIALENRIKHSETLLNSYSPKRIAMYLKNRISERDASLESLISKAKREMAHKLSSIERELEFSYKIIEGSNPKKLLERGYAIVQDLDGNTLENIASVKRVKNIKLVMNDGEIFAEVKDE